MLKRHEFTISLLQKGLDAFAIFFAWELAYLLRFQIAPHGEPGKSLFFLGIFPIITVLTLICFKRNGLYLSLRFKSRRNEIATIIKANSQSLLLFILLTYFFSPNKISRGMLLSYYLFSLFALISFRLSVRNYLRFQRSKGKNLRHVLLVGDGLQLERYVAYIRQFKDSGIRFKGWLGSQGLAEKSHLLSLEGNLEELKEKLHPDALILGFSSKNAAQLDSIINRNYNDITPIQILPDLSFSFIGHKIENYGGLPVISMNQPDLNTWDILIKRFFDVALTFPGFLLISPLLFLIGVAVKVTSPGPIFYGQERVGLDGKRFKMWKFRSMRVDAEAQSLGWTTANDPRKTKFGSFLRKTSLDELPQLWNVLVGDMSLVGPRPERPFYVEKFREEIPAYMLRHKMKAGITGWAQVNGWRGDTSLKKRIECDIYYIRNWSIVLDFKILFFTLWKGFINKNAY